MPPGQLLYPEDNGAGILDSRRGSGGEGEGGEGQLTEIISPGSHGSPT